MGKAGKIALAGGVAVLGIGALMALWDREPAKYSLEWIKGLSDVEWDKERDIMRQMYCNPKFSISERSSFQRILYLFDKVKSDRNWAGEKPHGPAYRREHGYNLYKP